MIDSSPFGKNSFDKMQTGKAYADEKPINPAIRVKSPELDKFVQEGSLEEFDKPAMKLKMQPMAGPTTVTEEEAKLGDYPDPLGKKFKPKEHYPKKKKKPTSSVKLSENFEDDEYEEIPDLEIPTDKRAAKMAQRDMSGVYGDEDKVEAGSDFHIDEKDDEPEVGDDNVTDTEFMDTERQGLQGGEQSEVEPPTEYDEPNMDMFANGVPDEIKNDNDGMSHEPESDEIEQIAQSKEEAGEMIPGGKGEGKSPLEFDPEQILMGMRVEMEHTEDPMIALEITIDHLTEDPEYYTAKEDPEASAQFGASKDANNGEDKDMENILLGFKPHNVGDNMESDEETPEEVPTEVDEEHGFEEYNGNVGDRYTDEEGNEFVVKDKVKGGVTLRGQSGEKEVATRDLQFMDKLNESENKRINSLITEEQIKIAKRTLSRSSVPTGMTKKEAVQILMNNNLKKIL